MVESPPTVLYLARHGQSMANQAGTFQGRLDSPLSALGLEQARLLGEHFKNKPIKSVYTSPLIRAHKTAETVASIHGLPVTMLEELIEFDVGMLAGVDYNGVYALYPYLMESLKTDPENTLFPEGESFGILSDRASRALSIIMQKSLPGDSILVISHNLILRTLTKLLLNLSWSNLWQLALDSAAYSLFSIYPGKPPILVNWNNTTHLGVAPRLKPGGFLGL